MHALLPRPLGRRSAPVLAVIALAVVLALAATALAPDVAWAQANVVGQWTTLPYTMPINPIHVSLLHTGKIVVVSGSGNDPTVTTYSAAVYDPVAGTIATQTMPWDLFCNGMTILPDGRALITGGTLQYDPFYGLKNTTAFDPVTQQFVRLQDMANGRWYPTNTVLADGRTATFSGYTETGGPNYSVELYTVGPGWSPQSWTPFTPPLYPRMHLLPNGKVFFSGPTPSSNLFDPSTQTWSVNIAQTNYGGTRTYGSSVLLPLTPQNNYDPQVLIMGGDNPATATVELIDLGAKNPAWQSMPSMALPRIEMNAVLLPNGKVLAQGGSAVDEDASTASLMAEIFDPATHTWTSMASATYPRLYHSVALLLPDATVWTAGSNPARGTYEPHMEIYKPPYLFTTDSKGNVVAAARPSITGAPTQVGYGASFQVQTPDAASIGSVVLVRAGADTHAFDMDQRLVGMNFTTGSGVLTVTSPPNASIAPPGYYMLFLVNKSGVPSVATFVQVIGVAGDQPPKGTITNPSADVTITAGQSVTFAGSGTDPDGSIASYSWVFPGGTPGSSNQATPGPVTFTTPGTYTASLTVIDNQGLNDPSPPVRTITVQSSPVTATFTSPAAGASLSGTVTVGMSATGTTGTSNTFALSVDGTLVSKQTTSGTTASYAWNTTTVPDGSHTLTLTVTDATGMAGTANLPVNVANNAPTLQVFITSPSAGATVSGTNWVDIWAQGTVGSSNVFTLSVGTGGTPVATQTSSGLHVTLPWDTTKVPNGPSTITATVQDAGGRTASTSVAVNVQNGGSLTASFTSPAAGSTVSGTVTVGMSASGTSGTSNTFKLSIDGSVALIQTTANTTASFAWDTTTVPNGSHTLALTVTDATGKSGAASETVTTSNATASVTASFTSPAAGATVTGNVTVGMSASGTSGTSNTFKLSVDGAVVSTQTVTGTTASYTWNTTTVTNASHTLSFTVTDATGKTGTASETVTVSNGGGGGTTGTLSVAITSPAVGATVSGVVWTDIWVSGQSGTSNTFTVSVAGSVVTSQVSSGSHVTLAWDSTKVPNGPETETATVTDATGNTGSATLPLNVQNAASVGAAFSSPAAGSTVSGTVTVGMSATGTSGTSNTFALSIDGTVVSTQTVSGTTASYSWNTTTAANAGHTLSFTVTDSTGASATASESVTVSNTTSSISASFASPAAGSTVSGTLTIGMTVTGASGSSNTFVLSIDGTQVSTQTVPGTTASYTWNTTTATNATHTLAFTVTDATGRSATASETVTVSNASGGGGGTLGVYITSPAAGSTVSGIVWSDIWLSGQSGTSNTYTLTMAGVVLASQVSSGTHVTLPWDSTKVPNGPQTLTAQVVDATGNNGTGTLALNVQNAPSSAVTASFTSPTSGSTVSGTVTIGMSATGTSGSSNTFVLSIDGTQVSSQTVAGTTASYTWDTTAAANTNHTLAFTVTDATGHSATASETVTVSNGTTGGGGGTTLGVFITSPTGGSTVSGVVWTDIWVSGQSGTSNTFTVSVAGTVLASQVSSGSHVTLAWDSTKVPNGPETETATVTDAAGDTGTATLNLNVKN